MQFENTYRLEGLIQGPLPPGPEGRVVIEKLAADFNRNGLRLTSLFDDCQFTLTAENVTRDTEEIHPLEVDLMVHHALEKLLGAYPQELRMQIFSTLRSREYRPNLEVQSIYLVIFPGQVKVERREVTAEVEPRPAPLSAKNQFGYLVAAVGILALLGWASTSLVEYRDLGEEKLSTLRGTRLEDLRVDDKSLIDFVRVVDVDLEKPPASFIVLTLRKGTKWPDDVTPLPPNSKGYTPAYRAAHRAAIEDRQLTVVLRDDQGAQTISKVSIREFFDDDKKEITVRIPFGTQVVRDLILRP
jgi:hypothetical protein